MPWVRLATITAAAADTGHISAVHFNAMRMIIINCPPSNDVGRFRFQNYDRKQQNLREIMADQHYGCNHRAETETNEINAILDSKSKHLG